MPFTGPKLTNFGLAVMLKYYQGKPLHLTRVALGDGEIGSGSMLTRTTLISEKLSVLIDAVRITDMTASIIAQISSDAVPEGFYFREKAVFARDPDTLQEGAILYDNCREQGEYINDKDSAHKVKFYLREHLTFSQTPEITFDASGNPIYVLYDDFNAQNSANDTRFTAIEESVADCNLDLANHIADDARHTSAAERASWNAKSSKSITAPITLTAAGWVEDAANGWWTQAVSVASVTATSPNEILPALGITEAQLMEFQAANIQDGGQAAGQITLKAWNFKPSINIPVRVIVRGDL